MAEFTKLREAVEKKGMAAKAAGQRHVTRKEMCEYITAYAAAEARWIDFTEAGVQICGIPAGIVNQLQEVHANTERTRVKVCADSVAPNGLRFGCTAPPAHFLDCAPDDRECEVASKMRGCISDGLGFFLKKPYLGNGANMLE